MVLDAHKRVLVIQFSHVVDVFSGEEMLDPEVTVGFVTPPHLVQRGS